MRGLAATLAASPPKGGAAGPEALEMPHRADVTKPDAAPSTALKVFGADPVHRE